MCRRRLARTLLCTLAPAFALALPLAPGPGWSPGPRAARADEAGPPEPGCAVWSDVEARLAALPGFEATVEVRDHVGGRTFEAEIAYAYPDRLVARLPDDAFLMARDGAFIGREENVVRRAEIARWIEGLLGDLAPLYRELEALEGEAGPGPGAPPAPEFAGAARRIGTGLGIRFHRRADRVSVTFLFQFRCRIARAIAGEPPARPPGFRFRFGSDEPAASAPSAIDPPGAEARGERVTFRQGDCEAEFLRASGLPVRVALLSSTGRLEAEVIFKSFRATPGVDAARFEAPSGATEGARAFDAPADLMEDVAGQAVRAFVGRIRADVARDPSLVTREGARVEDLLRRYYVAIYRSAYPEARLREEAKRAAEADGRTARAALDAAPAARRAETVDVLARRFRANARRELRWLKEGIQRVVSMAEDAIGGPAPDAGPEAEAARRRLVALSGRAVVAASEAAILDPMEAEARIELERLAAGGEPVPPPGAGEQKPPPGSGDRKP